MAKRIVPKKKTSPYDEKKLPTRVLGPGFTARKSIPGKQGLQVSSASADKTFNRGAKKPWVPKGGRAPQADLKVPDPKEPPVGRGAGYDGSKGFTRK